LKTINKKFRASTATNVRFGAMSAVARRQFCANLHVISPQAVQWKPPLRQAAGTLNASGATVRRDNEIVKQMNNNLKIEIQ
jgi:hypothetical protein